MIRKCVNEKTPSVGGIITDFGTVNSTLKFNAHRISNDIKGGDDELSVEVFATTSDVQCHGRVGGPGIRESCEGLIDRMEATEKPIFFGPRLPYADVKLPWAVRDGMWCQLLLVMALTGLISNRAK